MPAKPTPTLDPYATLGLEPGAPMAEVKRAYRSLAKAFHPDSAGERAIPRFLAIQAAYEQIRTGRVTLGGARSGRGSAAPASGGASAAGAASEPWRADPARARAARERARAGGAPSTAAGAGGPKGTGGATGRATGGRASAGSAGATGSTGTTGTTGSTGSGSGPRRRATRKATMGSTSYDEARDPADPTWGGASWYGPSSGEYWIVNPREYADPRKHGPDYQQRARRLAQEQAATRPDGIATDAEPSTMEEPPAEAAPRASATPRGTATQRETPRARSTPRWAADAPRPSRVWAGDAPPATPRADEPPAPFRWLGAPADDPVRRLGLALVAWPPIGLALAALIGDATGCSSFGAQCDGAEPMLPWLAQAVVLGVLLLLPPVTRILAFGTVAVLVGLVPITVFLLAVGASGAPQAGTALAVLLAAIWAVGVALALAMRARRLPAWPVGGRGARS